MIVIYHVERTLFIFLTHRQEQTVNYRPGCGASVTIVLCCAELLCNTLNDCTLEIPACLLSFFFSRVLSRQTHLFQAVVSIYVNIRKSCVLKTNIGCSFLFFYRHHCQRWRINKFNFVLSRYLAYWFWLLEGVRFILLYIVTRCRTNKNRQGQCQCR